MKLKMVFLADRDWLSVPDALWLSFSDANTYNKCGRITDMKTLIPCEFNIDSACVELKYSDGTMISIDTIAVENDFAATWLDRRELDYLIYSDPWRYADLVLNGDEKKHLDTVRRRQ